MCEHVFNIFDIKNLTYVNCIQHLWFNMIVLKGFALFFQLSEVSGIAEENIEYAKETSYS